MGYSGVYKLKMGLLHSENITWNGNYGNYTYNELQDILFDADFTSYYIVASEFSYGKNKSYETKTETVYIVPYGLCKRFSFTDGLTNVISKRKTVVLLVDPAKLNKLSLSNMAIARGEFGPNINKLYDGFNHEVQISLHDHTLQDGLTCNDYASQQFGYGDCLEQQMEENFLEWFDCLPPWFSNASGLMCEIDRKVQVPPKEVLAEVKKEILRYVKGLDLKMFQKCLPPCTTMSMDLTLLSQFSSRVEDGYVLIEAKPSVTVYTGMKCNTIY